MLMMYTNIKNKISNAMQFGTGYEVVKYSEIRCDFFSVILCKSI